MGVWFDRLIVSVIVAVGLIILYRALKEPLDLLFGMIKKGLGGLRDQLSGGGGEVAEVIHYG